MTPARVIWEKEISTERMFPPDWPVDTPVGRLLIDDRYRRARVTVGSTTPGPGCYRKQAEQATESKSTSSTPPRPLLQFPSPVPALTSPGGGLLPGNLNRNTPFTPQLAFGHGVATVVKTLRCSRSFLVYCNTVKRHACPQFRRFRLAGPGWGLDQVL